MARIEENIMHLIQKGDYSKDILESIYRQLLEGFKW